MLSIPGKPGATCDGISRRELLRVGGAGLLGLSLANLLRFESAARAAGPTTAPAASAPAGGKQTGFGSAKNFIFIFLQGGPSHLDIWDPKPDAPDNIRGQFKPIPTKIKGEHVSEVMPNLANVLERFRESPGRSLHDATAVSATPGAPLSEAARRALLAFLRLL